MTDHSTPSMPTIANVATRRDDVADRRAANRAVGVSALGLGLTGLVELSLAIFTGSVALLGDALHNLSDVSTSAVVFLGFRISKRPPSPSHPYGFERAEDLAGLGVALVIWASAVFAGYVSYRKFEEVGTTSHVGIGMLGAVLGIAGNHAVAWYKGGVSRRIRSAALSADAKHSWLDAMSSLGALIGLIAVAFGRPLGDPIAGFAVTLFILHVGYEVTRDMLHHLMDGVEPEHLDAARQAATGVPQVDQAVVRGRWMGRSLLLEVEARVREGLSLKEVDAIGREVETAVLGAVEAATQVRWLPASAVPMT